MADTDTDTTDLTTLTVDLLSAYFANNTIPSDQLAGLIKATHEALKGIEAPAGPVEPEQPAHVPAVSVRKSLASSEHILSMIDGKPYKMLKRHLGTHGLTPAEYRERYNLPKDYPMVAKAYSEQRRDVAAKIGLGRTVQSKAADAPVVSVAEPAAAKPTSASPEKAAKAQKGKSAAVAAAKPLTATKKKAASKTATATIAQAPAVQAETSRTQRTSKAASQAAAPEAPSPIASSRKAPRKPATAAPAVTAAVEPGISEVVEAPKKTSSRKMASANSVATGKATLIEAEAVASSPLVSAPKTSPKVKAPKQKPASKTAAKPAAAGAATPEAAAQTAGPDAIVEQAPLVESQKPRVKRPSLKLNLSALKAPR